MRTKKLIWNSITSLASQLMTIVCGLILPRLIIGEYGSQVNGLVSSISQFLSVIALLDMGVGAVVQAALYKPLAEKDNAKISAIFVSAERFFKRIALILLGYVLILTIVYPYVVNDAFDNVYVISLIIIIALSSFMQYYWGVTNQIVLNADQRIYIQAGLQCIVLILNVIFSYILIKVGVSIHVVKFASALVFIMRPVLMKVYVRKKYKIDHKIKFAGEPIKQKWNGMAQHIASYVLDNTDIVVLTLFSSLKSVSIYTVYFNVVHGMRKLVMSFFSGFQSMWGNMLAKGEDELLEKSFDKTEWLIHNVVTFLFSVTGVLIVPFVKLYTKGITDVNYILPLFSLLLVLASASHCMRLPYMMMIYSAGAFKETQRSAWIEATINIVLSVSLVVKFDLIGVAVGTLAAMVYRTIYLAVYLSKNILNRNLKFFIKRVIADAFCVILFILFIHIFNISIVELSVQGWIFYAILITVLMIICLAIGNVCFEFRRMKSIVLFFEKRLKRK